MEDARASCTSDAQMAAASDPTAGPRATSGWGWAASRRDIAARASSAAHATTARGTRAGSAAAPSSARAGTSTPAPMAVASSAAARPRRSIAAGARRNDEAGTDISIDGNVRRDGAALSSSYAGTHDGAGSRTGSAGRTARGGATATTGGIDGVALRGLAESSDTGAEGFTSVNDTAGGRIVATSSCSTPVRTRRYASLHAARQK